MFSYLMTIPSLLIIRYDENPGIFFSSLIVSSTPSVTAAIVLVFFDGGSADSNSQAVLI